MDFEFTYPDGQVKILGKISEILLTLNAHNVAIVRLTIWVFLSGGADGHVRANSSVTHCYSRADKLSAYMRDFNVRESTGYVRKILFMDGWVSVRVRIHM